MRRVHSVGAAPSRSLHSTLSPLVLSLLLSVTGNNKFCHFLPPPHFQGIDLLHFCSAGVYSTFAPYKRVRSSQGRGAFSDCPSGGGGGKGRGRKRLECAIDSGFALSLSLSLRT